MNCSMQGALNTRLMRNHSIHYENTSPCSSLLVLLEHFSLVILNVYCCLTGGKIGDELELFAKDFSASRSGYRSPLSQSSNLSSRLSYSKITKCPIFHCCLPFQNMSNLLPEHTVLIRCYQSAVFVEKRQWNNLSNVKRHF